MLKSPPSAPRCPDGLAVEEPSPKGLQPSDRYGKRTSSLDESEGLGEQLVQCNSPRRIAAHHGKVDGAVVGEHIFSPLGSELKQEKDLPVEAEDLRALKLASVTEELGRISFRGTYTT